MFFASYYQLSMIVRLFFVAFFSMENVCSFCPFFAHLFVCLLISEKEKKLARYTLTKKNSICDQSINQIRATLKIIKKVTTEAAAFDH